MVLRVKLKRIIITAFLITVSLLGMCVLGGSSSSAEEKTLTIYGSIDGSIATERILARALEQMGYELNTALQGLNFAMQSVAGGEGDGLFGAPREAYNDYENIVMVDFQISTINFTVFQRTGDNNVIKSWSDLSGKRVGYIINKPYLERYLPLDVAEKTSYTSNYKMLQGLANGEFDVCVAPIYEEVGVGIISGTEQLSVIDSQPIYPCLNEKHIELIPVLEKILNEMEENGEIDEIKNSVSYNSDSDTVTILELYSYGADMKWEDELKENLRSKRNGELQYNVYDTVLNFLRNKNDLLRQQSLNNVLHADFKDKSPNLIMVSSNEALQFIKENYYALFKKIPVLFYGIDDYSPDDVAGYEEYFTGFNETIEAKATVEMMLRLFPDKKKIFIINDYSYSGMRWRSAIEKELSDIKPGITLEYNEDLSMTELERKLHSLGDDTMVLSGFYFVDKDLKYFSENVALEYIRNSTDCPIFTLMYSAVGHGPIGGRVVSPEKQSVEVQKIANRIINGEDISKILIHTDTEDMNEWLFDKDALEKWRISEKALPENSVILNKRLPFREEEPLFFTVIIISFCFAVVVITLLTFFVTKQRKQNIKLMMTQKNLHTAEEMLLKDAEIRKNQSQLQTVLETLTHAVIILRLDDSSIVYCNDAYVKILGFDNKVEAQGCSVSDISADLQCDGRIGKRAQLEINRQYIEREHSHGPFEWTFSRAGIDFMGQVTCSYIKYNDIDCYVAVIRDITIDKKREESLRRAVELERDANQMKSKFVVNISHEIRTPMNAIIGLTEIAMLKKADSDAYATFEKIHTSAKHLLSLINDVLDFSKIEADKFELINDNFVLQDVLSEALLLTSQRLNKKEVELSLSVDSMLPRVLYGDKTRLWQILKNILDNSAKFTDNGRIYLKVSQLQKVRNNITIEFTITDTGSGMGEKQLEKLFVPYEQFDVNNKNGIIGTGLGMSITKQLTELMGGNIKVSSKIRQGTTIKITIPFQTPDEDYTIERELGEFKLRRLRVLVIDYDTLSNTIIEDILNSIDAVSVTTPNITEGSKIILYNEGSNTPFDIVMVNQNMINMIDIGLCRSKKFILKSAYHKHSIPSEIRRLGYNDVIEKPFTPLVFINKIANVLGKNNSLGTKKKLESFSGASVLLVEDNEINQEVAATMLEMLGINPVITGNGVEALSALENQHFDLIFMDLIMPIMNGFDTTSHIRNSGKPYKNIPIIAMTANVIKEEIQKCIEQGMNSHIGKPIDIAGLTKQLMQWLPDKYTSRGSGESILKPVAYSIAEDSIDLSKTSRGDYVLASKKFTAMEAPFNCIDDIYADTVRALNYLAELRKLSKRMGITKLDSMLLEMQNSIKTSSLTPDLYNLVKNNVVQIKQTIKTNTHL